MTERVIAKEQLSYTTRSRIVLAGLPGSGKTSLLEAVATRYGVSQSLNKERTAQISLRGEYPFCNFEEGTQGGRLHLQRYVPQQVHDEVSRELLRLSTPILQVTTGHRNHRGTHIGFEHEINIVDPMGSVVEEVSASSQGRSALSSAADQYVSYIKQADTIMFCLPVDARDQTNQAHSFTSAFDGPSTQEQIDTLKRILALANQGQHVAICLTKTDCMPNLRRSPQEVYDFVYRKVLSYKELMRLYPQVKLYLTTSAGFVKEPQRRASAYDFNAGGITNNNTWKPVGTLDPFVAHINRVEEQIIQEALKSPGCLDPGGLRLKRKFRINYQPFGGTEYTTS